MKATTRLFAGATGLLATSFLARRSRLNQCELELFRVVNNLPDSLYRPLWPVMQAGNLGAAPVAAALVAARGRPVLARRLLAAGAATWLLSKVVKGLVRRPRPEPLLPATRLRGRAQSGLGFVSGHAGVAAALCVATLPELDERSRPLAEMAAVTVALSRVYIGAHLPLDVVGGACLGLAAEAAVDLFVRPGVTEPAGRPAVAPDRPVPAR